MKRIAAIIGLYFVLFVMNISCRREHFLITGIRFESATLDKEKAEMRFNDYVPTSVFTKDIVFVISYETVFVALNSFNLNSNCHALTLGKIMDNKLLDETFSISLDHPFIYNSDTVKTNQNILENASIKKEIEIFESNQAFHNSGADKVFSFSDYFMKNAKFDTISYNVAFYCKTSDNIEFNEQISVKFRIE
ncbi:MAG: hypothetical protein K0M40_08150 [Prolixibacteraceae bacterium]|nr:hypothetical protein [Prolixibacteraceae bacterium]